jgi:predicted transcriptional regulator
MISKSIADKERRVLEFIKANPNLSSKDIHEGFQELGYAAIKRTLQKLLTENLLVPSGKGKATRYQVSPVFELLYPLDLEEYFKKEIDERV